MWTALHILEVHSLANSRLCAGEWCPWGRPLSFSIHSGHCVMNPGRAHLQFPLKDLLSWHWTKQSSTLTLRRFSARKMQSCLDNLMHLWVWQLWSARCSRAELWLSRARSKNSGWQLKTHSLNPVSLGIKPGWAQRGAGRAEGWWTRDGSTGRSYAQHQWEPAIYRHRWENRYRRCRCDWQEGGYALPGTTASMNGFWPFFFFFFLL